MITFILNFVVAYFIYGDSGYVKPLMHSIIILALVITIDLTMKNKKKKDDYM